MPKIDLLTLQLAILILPGCLWHFTDRDLRSPRSLSQLDAVFRILGGGTALYTIAAMAVGVGLKLGDYLGGGLSLGPTLAAPIADVELTGVHFLIATLLGIPLAFLTAAAATNKWLYTLAQKWNVSLRRGDEPVWDLVLASEGSEWATVRVFGTSVIYSGVVRGYSEGTDARELWLESVTVYQLEDGTELYRCPRLHLPLPKDGFHIEFPNAEPDFLAYSPHRKEPPDGKASDEGQLHSQ